jgi:hypothetical protein
MLSYIIEPITQGFQQYPDLDRMSAERLDEFLEKSQLTPLQKSELKAAPNKVRFYSEVKTFYDLNKAIDVYNNFHATFSKNGIFIIDKIKVQFAAIDQLLKEAIIERQVQPKTFEKGATLHSHGQLLLKALERDVQGRLWSSQDTEGE